MNGVVGQTGPCVAALELASIAAGFETVDALLKEADVEVLQRTPVSPGKYVIVFTGAVEDVLSALRRGEEVAGAQLLDRLFIPNLEPTLLALMRGDDEPPLDVDAVGILETLSVASTIRAADVAAKTATLKLVSLRLARGIGGKSFVTFTGEVSDVEAAVTAGGDDAERAGLLVRRVVIPRPRPELLAALLEAGA